MALDNDTHHGIETAPDIQHDASVEPTAMQQGSLFNGTKDISSAKPERTLGLKLVDAGIYGMNNIVVTGVSVAFTYLTQYGDKVAESLEHQMENQQGVARGMSWAGAGLSRFLNQRGTTFKHWLMDNKITGQNINESLADSLKMITFSFADGSLTLPAVKALEDQREVMAKKIDDLFGTTPDDLSVYDAEPKQSWGSILKGRIAALSVVLPMAVTLNKFGTDKEGHWGINKDPDDKTFNSMNDKLFFDRGRWAGEQLEKIPAFSGIDGKIGIPNVVPDLVSTALFEAFYTVLCTQSLYVFSRMAAAVNGKDKQDMLAQGLNQPSFDYKSIATPAMAEEIAANNIVAFKRKDKDAMTQQVSENISNNDPLIPYTKVTADGRDKAESRYYEGKLGGGTPELVLS